MHGAGRPDAAGRTTLAPQSPFLFFPLAPSARACPMLSPGGGEDTEQQTQMDATAPTTPPVETPPAAEPGKPWARLVGVGPTAGFGVVDLHEKQVIFGNARKNSDAPVRVDDPRIRCACV